MEIEENLKFSKCTENYCDRCDIGYILKNYIRPIMQCLTNDIKEYYMKLLTTKCLNSAVMISFFMLGKEKTLEVANYCDNGDTKKRHQSNIDNNNDIILRHRNIILKNNYKFRYLYYILLTDGYFTFDDKYKKSAYFPGHVFILEQIPNKPYYYLYQSYINQYDLKQYIEKNNRTLKFQYKKVKKLLDDLQYILNTDKWDDSCIKKWKEFTHVDTSELKDSRCKNNFFLCIKRSKVVDCLKHIKLYTKQKLDEIEYNKKINADNSNHLNNIYGNKQLYDKNQIQLTNNEMYYNLKNLYDNIKDKSDYYRLNKI